MHLYQTARCFCPRPLFCLASHLLLLPAIFAAVRENWPGNGGFPDPDWQPGDSGGTRNHIFLCGGLVEWYWKHLVGLTPTSPAFATLRIAPKVRPYLGPTDLQATFEIRASVTWQR